MSVVPFGSNAVSTYVAPQASAAQQALDFIWNNRGKFSKMGRKTLRATHKSIRKYTKRGRKRRLPRRRGVRNKKARISGAKGRAFTNREYPFASGAPSALGDLTNLRRKELHVRELVFCGNADTNDDLRNAPGRRFWVSGVNICTTFKNDTLNVPIRVHLAMVQPKEFESNPNDFDQDFFKSSQSGSDIYENFNSTARAWNMDYDCFGINRRKFNIVTHTKFIVRPRGDANNADREHMNFRHLEKYYKINKVFEFDNSTDTSVSKPLYLLIWWDSLLGTDGLAAESTDLGVIMRTTTFFKAAQAVTRF